LSSASNDADSAHESGLQGLAIDANYQGQANFALTVGALGNVSDTQVDGSQDMAFRESAVGEFTIDGDEDDGGPHTSGHNLNDPDILTMLMT